jgi:hypothetical protein
MLGVVALVAAVLAMPALAQDDGSTSPETATESEDTTGSARFEEAQTAFAEALAAELDLPVDDVSAALDAVREQMAQEHQERHQAALRERLDEAVAAGELTQDQADAIADAAEAGVLGRGGRGGHGPGGMGHGRPGWFGGDGMLSDDGVTEDATQGQT